MYASLGRTYHKSILLKEKWHIGRKYPATKFVNYDRSTLKAIKAERFRSQYGQDHFLIKEGLVPEKAGRFIDIGCNDPISA